MDELPYIPEVDHDPPTPLNSKDNKSNNTFENL